MSLRHPAKIFSQLCPDPLSIAKRFYVSSRESTSGDDGIFFLYPNLGL
jgi:hypothetical protein